ncbi:hypothetical protein IE53DRAFT_154011 [Violaceomyces palustris]|uniref:Uncharacterized protein n=1 Tax=Violaceomyces palustris TaxID=1673888 RepID=A0ACD0P6C6_9BASI|nr:hypothetical protein IE53DRAFT_154011 [Violaceomyces palustris]
MALNLDDLIGSMQHGFHAGDKGTDINEMRENLKAALGTHALGPGAVGAAAGASGAGSSYVQRRMNMQQPSSSRYHWEQPPPHSSLDADVAMLSSSMDVANAGGFGASPSNANGAQQPSGRFPYQNPSTQYGRSPMSMSSAHGADHTPFGLYANGYGQAGTGGGPGSVGSIGSSSNFSTASFGFAAAPANTPQQTPVESSALAQQLQQELARAREGQSGLCTVDEAGSAQEGSPSARSARSQSFSPSHHQDYQYDFRDHSSPSAVSAAENMPRKLVNGFSPSQPASYAGSSPSSVGDGLLFGSPNGRAGNFVGAPQ